MKKNLVFVILLLVMAGCNKNEGFSFDEQLAIDIAAIDAYLSEENIDALVDDSGIRYTVLKEGLGNSPGTSDSIRVVYEGRFFNGEVFDPGSEVVFSGLFNLIAAWQIMVPKMKTGEKITIYAPSVYCYGRRGNFSIPPNTNLIFDIELLEVK